MMQVRIRAGHEGIDRGVFGEVLRCSLQLHYRLLVTALGKQYICEADIKRPIRGIEFDSSIVFRCGFTQQTHASIRGSANHMNQLRVASYGLRQLCLLQCLLWTKQLEFGESQAHMRFSVLGITLYRLLEVSSRTSGVTKIVQHI